MNRVAARLATLARQLARYLAQSFSPVTNASQEKRRLTYRRRVIRDNLRNAKALREHGTEVGWRGVHLNNDETALAERLAQGDG